MKTVYKYPLTQQLGQGGDTFTVYVPAGAQLLTVQLQRRYPPPASCTVPMLWALVNTDNQIVPYTLRIAGTGHPLADEGHYRYLGTVQLAGGALVFHYFEVVPF